MSALRADRPLELDKAALFGHLGYEPHKGQWLVHRSGASRRVLACGVRWGKSTCGAMEAVAALLEPRDRSLGWVVAPTMSLTAQVFDRIRFALHDRFASRIVEDDERERRMVIRNLGGGLSEVLAKSADNPVGLLGAALDWVIVDECARLRRFVWEQILSARLIDRGGWGLLMSTPTGCNHFWELVHRGERNRDPDFESWRSPSWTNPHVNRDLIDAERGRMSAEAFGQEYEAEFAGEEEMPCELCKGPSSTLVRSILIFGEDEPMRCKECRRLVHDDGTTAVMRFGKGEPCQKIVRVLGDTAVPPETTVLCEGAASTVPVEGNLNGQEPPELPG